MNPLVGAGVSSALYHNHELRELRSKVTMTNVQPRSLDIDGVTLVSEDDVRRVVDEMTADIEAVLIHAKMRTSVHNCAVEGIVSALTSALNYGGDRRWRIAYNAIATTIQPAGVTLRNESMAPSRRIGQFLRDNRDLLEVVNNG